MNEALTIIITEHFPNAILIMAADGNCDFSAPFTKAKATGAKANFTAVLDASDPTSYSLSRQSAEKF